VDPRRSSRRRFLARTAAAVAAPTVLAGVDVRGAEKNERPTVALVGAGNKGTNDGLAKERDGGHLMAVCDLDTQRIAAFQRRAPRKLDEFTDYRRVLDRPDIDTLVIATPDHWHTKILIDACRAGKDVFCEKPMTLTIDEGKIIRRVVEETGRVVQIGTQQRFHRYNSAFLRGIAVVRAGLLGEKVNAVCGLGPGPTGGPFPTSEPPANLDWEMWLGQAPKVPYCPERCHGSFRWFLEYSGGKVTDWGVHHVDIAQWALGYDMSGPTHVEGNGQFPVIPEDFDLDAFFDGKLTLPNSYNTVTTFEAKLTFPGGETIAITPGPRRGIMFEGERGRIFVNRGGPNGKPVEQMTAAERQEVERIMAEDLWGGIEPKSIHQDFLDCTKTRERPIANVFTHQRSVTSCHLCNIAMLLGRPLRWDPEAEDFIGDEQATALMSRRQRKPYTIEV
jgi:predicted dehydrogenase